jgi:hypothetical protein
VQLGHAPLIHVLSATHRVGEVHFPIVPVVHVGERCSDPAFCHNSVRLSKKGFANESDANSGRGRFNRSAQPGAASTDDENVVLKGFVIGHAWIER